MPSYGEETWTPGRCRTTQSPSAPEQPSPPQYSQDTASSSLIPPRTHNSTSMLPDTHPVAGLLADATVLNSPSQSQQNLDSLLPDPSAVALSSNPSSASYSLSNSNIQSEVSQIPANSTVVATPSHTYVAPIHHPMRAIDHRPGGALALVPAGAKPSPYPRYQSSPAGRNPSTTPLCVSICSTPREIFGNVSLNSSKTSSDFISNYAYCKHIHTSQHSHFVKHLAEHNTSYAYGNVQSLVATLVLSTPQSSNVSSDVPLQPVDSPTAIPISSTHDNDVGELPTAPEETQSHTTEATRDIDVGELPTALEKEMIHITEATRDIDEGDLPTAPYHLPVECSPKIPDNGTTALSVAVDAPPVVLECSTLVEDIEETVALECPPLVEDNEQTVALECPVIMGDNVHTSSLECPTLVENNEMKPQEVEPSKSEMPSSEPKEERTISPSNIEDCVEFQWSATLLGNVVEEMPPIVEAPRPQIPKPIPQQNVLRNDRRPRRTSEKMESKPKPSTSYNAEFEELKSAVRNTQELNRALLKENAKLSGDRKGWAAAYYTGKETDDDISDFVQGPAEAFVELNRKFLDSLMKQENLAEDNSQLREDLAKEKKKTERSEERANRKETDLEASQQEKLTKLRKDKRSVEDTLILERKEGKRQIEKIEGEKKLTTTMLGSELQETKRKIEELKAEKLSAEAMVGLQLEEAQRKVEELKAEKISAETMLSSQLEDAQRQIAELKTEKINKTPSLSLPDSDDDSTKLPLSLVTSGMITKNEPLSINGAKLSKHVPKYQEISISTIVWDIHVGVAARDMEPEPPNIFDIPSWIWTLGISLAVILMFCLMHSPNIQQFETYRPNTCHMAERPLLAIPAPSPNQLPNPVLACLQDGTNNDSEPPGFPAFSFPGPADGLPPFADPMREYFTPGVTPRVTPPDATSLDVRVFDVLSFLALIYWWMF
ncbi:hypothetical protein N431DRAFT_514762 [Stipitochalara longipes BDJ]|nr:hypothetical protein N431DRAFT_514762 [Stipitochalara longipes BDJ]